MRKDDEKRPFFRFKILGTFQDCLTRQLTEAVLIEEGVNLLNSKREWGSNHVPRLQVSQDDYIMKKKIYEEELKEKEAEKQMRDFIDIKKKKKNTEDDITNTERTPHCIGTCIPYPRDSPEKEDDEDEVDKNETEGLDWDWLDIVIRKRKLKKLEQKKLSSARLTKEIIEEVVDNAADWLHMRTIALESMGRTVDMSEKELRIERGLVVEGVLIKRGMTDLVQECMKSAVDMVERKVRVEKALEAKRALIVKIEQRKERLLLKKKKEEQFRKMMTTNMARVTELARDIVSIVVDNALTVSIRREQAREQSRHFLAMDMGTARELTLSTPILVTRPSWMTDVRKRRRGDRERLVSVLVEARERRSCSATGYDWELMEIDFPFFTDGARPATATQRHHQDPDEHLDVDPHHVAQVHPHHPVTNLVEGALAEVAGLSAYTSMFDMDTGTDNTGADIITNNLTGDKPSPTTTATSPPPTSLKEQEAVEVQPNIITIKGEVSLRHKPETKEKLETNTILRYFGKDTPVRDCWVQEEEHPHLHGKHLVPRPAPHDQLKNVCLQKYKLGNAQPLRAPTRRNRNKTKTTDQKLQPSISKYFPKQADTGSGLTTTQFMGEKRKREEETC